MADGDPRVGELEAEVASLEKKLEEAADSGGGDSEQLDELKEELENAYADREAAQDEAKQYRKEARRLQEDLERLEAEAESGGGGGGDGDMAQFSESVTELYGTVSSMKPDLRSLRDALDLLEGDDDEDRADGLEMLRDGLDAMNGRARDLKILAGDIQGMLE